MGDVRFRHAYSAAARAEDRARYVRDMPTEELVMALAATSLPRDPLVVNVLATELQNRVRRTSAAIESIPEGVMIVERSGTITYANPTALQLTGRTLHDIVGTPAETFRVLDERGERIPWDERPIRRALELGETASRRDAMLDRNDGTRFPVSILAAPILDEGHVLGAVVAFRDITEERRTEMQLRFHHQLLDAVSDAVVATTLDGRISYWNAGAQRLYGWTPEEVIGRNVVDVTPTEASRDAAAEIMEALREGRSWSGTFPVRGRDGRSFLAHVTNAPVLDERGQLAGIIGVSRPAERGPGSGPP